MSLRPPPPALRSLTADRVSIQLRILAPQGISIGGAGMQAVNAHHLSRRDVVVRIDPSDPDSVLMYGPDGVPHRAVGAAAFTDVFREAFYLQRSQQRDEIAALVTAREPDAAPKPADRPIAAGSVPAHPDAIAARSPLDAFKPLARMGWPFDELREAPPDCSRPSRTPEEHDAPPLR